MKEITSHFIIDKESNRVVCRNCRQECHSLTMGEDETFVCTNQRCLNSLELRRTSNGKWHVATLSEIWGLGAEDIKKILKST